MDVASEIPKIETRLRNAGVTVKQLLAEADVDDAQWWRWRERKHKPLRTTWARIVAAADKLAPRRAR